MCRGSFGEGCECALEGFDLRSHAMRIDVLTLFPGMFAPLQESILGRASKEGLIDLHLHDIREFSKGNYKQVDDSPYGGGAGMVMMCEVIVPLIEKVTADRGQGTTADRPHRIYLTATGERLTQERVETISQKHDWLLLLCGHYEGVDQRIIEGWIDEEISIGDYVLTGGELPAMVLIDAVARHIPGVLGKEESAAEESFSAKLGRKREYPHYTKPADFRGMKVPDVLMSGNHKEIKKWRTEHLR